MLRLFARRYLLLLTAYAHSPVNVIEMSNSSFQEFKAWAPGAAAAHSAALQFPGPSRASDLANRTFSAQQMAIADGYFAAHRSAKDGGYNAAGLKLVRCCIRAVLLLCSCVAAARLRALCVQVLAQLSSNHATSSAATAESNTVSLILGPAIGSLTARFGGEASWHSYNVFSPPAAETEENAGAGAGRATKPIKTDDGGGSSGGFGAMLSAEKGRSVGLGQSLHVAVTVDAAAVAALQVKIILIYEDA